MCAAPPLTWSTSCCAVHGKSYFVETSRRLGNGFGEHLRWTTTNIDPPVGGHFSSPGHDTKDILIAVICAGYGMVRRGREWRRAKLIFHPTAFCTCVDWTQTLISFHFIQYIEFHAHFDWSCLKENMIIFSCYDLLEYRRTADVMANLFSLFRPTRRRMWTRLFRKEQVKALKNV